MTINRRTSLLLFTALTILCASAALCKASPPPKNTAMAGMAKDKAAANMANERARLDKAAKQLADENARIQSYNAQTEYYKAAAQKLKENPTFWRKALDGVANNPAALFAAIAAALLTGIFGYRQFYLTYLASRQDKQSDQFYEALKRFGDRDNVSIRCSASGLLAGLAADPVQPWHLFRKKRPNTWKSSSFFDMAVDQLAIGLALEDDNAALFAIENAFDFLILINPEFILERLHGANVTIQSQIVQHLASLCDALGVQSISEIKDPTWDQVQFATYITPEPFIDLVSRPRWNRQFEFLLGFVGTLGGPPTRKSEGHKEMSHALLGLAKAMNRLGSSQRVLVRAAHSANLKGCDLQDVYLVGHSLENLDMTNCNLTGALLHGVNFRGTKLDGARLGNAKLECAELAGATLSNCNLTNAMIGTARITDRSQPQLPEANFSGANWWQASFRPVSTSRVDQELIALLYQRYGISSDAKGIDPDVAKYIDESKHRGEGPSSDH